MKEGNIVKTNKKNPEVINREDLLKDIAEVYVGRYDRSYDQAVHDLYNAIVKRIRRAPNCAEKQKKEEEGTCNG